jgi:hypothetical protein
MCQRRGHFGTPSRSYASNLPANTGSSRRRRDVDVFGEAHVSIGRTDPPPDTFSSRCACNAAIGAGAYTGVEVAGTVGALDRATRPAAVIRERRQRRESDRKKRCYNCTEEHCPLSHAERSLKRKHTGGTPRMQRLSMCQRRGHFGTPPRSYASNLSANTGSSRRRRDVDGFGEAHVSIGRTDPPPDTFSSRCACNAATGAGGDLCVLINNAFRARKAAP